MFPYFLISFTYGLSIAIKFAFNLAGERIMKVDYFMKF